MDGDCAEMEMEKNKKGLVVVGMELEMVTVNANSFCLIIFRNSSLHLVR